MYKEGLRPNESEELGLHFGGTTLKSSISNFKAIEDSVLGEYAKARLFRKTLLKSYYSIRSLCGLLAKNSFQDFNWNVFKERFATAAWKSRRKALFS